MKKQHFCTWGELYLKESPSLVRYVSTKVQNPVDVEYFVEKAFEKAEFKEIWQTVPKNKVRAYLRTIVRNLVTDRRRARMNGLKSYSELSPVPLEDKYFIDTPDFWNKRREMLVNEQIDQFDKENQDAWEYKFEWEKFEAKNSQNIVTAIKITQDCSKDTVAQKILGWTPKKLRYWRDKARKDNPGNRYIFKSLTGLSTLIDWDDLILFLLNC